MDPAALAGRLEAIEGRAPGSDAERRAAMLVARTLRDGGRRPRVKTLWIRPHRNLPRAVLALLGVAATIVAVEQPEIGLALAVAALLGAALEAFGVPTLGLLLARRATQNVVAASAGPREGRVLVVLAASVAAPPGGVLGAAERALPRFVPGALGWLLVGLAGVIACAAARMAGAEGSAVGAAQLVPSVLLLALLGAWVDAGLALPHRTPAGGPAAAAAVAAALDAQPPRALDVEVLIAGSPAAYVRERRHELDPEDVVLIELASAKGALRYATHAGELVPLRLHPQLTAAAARIPGARPFASRGRSAARLARGRRWPAVALEGEPRALAAGALRIVAEVDRQVAQAAQPERR